MEPATVALQYSYTGTATDLPLMQWLDHYTFPREAALQDLALAKREYSQLIARLLAHGTTTVLYFATLHLAPTLLFADLLKAAGQRAYVGKARHPGLCFLNLNIYILISSLVKTGCLHVLLLKLGLQDCGAWATMYLEGRLCIKRLIP